jgi:hypothetical protein
MGWLGDYCMMLGTHLFVLPNVSWAGLEPVAAVAMVVMVAAHLFSQCNVAWGSGCQSIDSPWCFSSAKCGLRISARFLTHGAHAF